MGKAEPGSANQVSLWNTALLEVKFSHHGSARAQHAIYWRDHQSGRIALHKEGAKPALAFGEYQKQICNLRKRDPFLVSAKKKIIPAGNRLCPDFPRVTSGFRFGEGKCGDGLPLPQPFQPFGFLRIWVIDSAGILDIRRHQRLVGTFGFATPLLQRDWFNAQLLCEF